MYIATSPSSEQPHLTHKLSSVFRFEEETYVPKKTYVKYPVQHIKPPKFAVGKVNTAEFTFILTWVRYPSPSDSHNWYMTIVSTPFFLLLAKKLLIFQTYFKRIFKIYFKLSKINIKRTILTNK